MRFFGPGSSSDSDSDSGGSNTLARVSHSDEELLSTPSFVFAITNRPRLPTEIEEFFGRRACEASDAAKIGKFFIAFAVHEIHLQITYFLMIVRENLERIQGQIYGRTSG